MNATLRNDSILETKKNRKRQSEDDEGEDEDEKANIIQSNTSHSLDSRWISSVRHKGNPSAICRLPPRKSPATDAPCRGIFRSSFYGSGGARRLITPAGFRTRLNLLQRGSAWDGRERPSQHLCLQTEDHRWRQKQNGWRRRWARRAQREMAIS
jgi:hypothetical protein